MAIEWVMVSRWDHGSARVEYLDRPPEIGAEDDSFDSGAAAEGHVAERFGVGADEWSDGLPTPA